MTIQIIHTVDELVLYLDELREENIHDELWLNLSTDGVIEILDDDTVIVGKIGMKRLLLVVYIFLL